MKIALIFVDIGRPVQVEPLVAYAVAVRPDFKIVIFTAAPMVAETGIA